jgi:hypothetical protein
VLRAPLHPHASQPPLLCHQGEEQSKWLILIMFLHNPCYGDLLLSYFQRIELSAAAYACAHFRCASHKTLKAWHGQVLDLSVFN